MNNTEILGFNKIPLPPIGCKKLEKKRVACDEDFKDEMGLRMRRAVSWIDRAEQLSKGNEPDLDMQFISLWIALNAICANSKYLKNKHEIREFRSRQLFFEKVLPCDEDSVLKQAIEGELKDFIDRIFKNKFLYYKYWEFSHSTKDASNWKAILNQSIRSFKNACRKKEYNIILEELFDRLYVMRNQLMHGGATWKSSVNREQLEDCVVVLGYFLPLFVDIMMSHPKVDWGKPYYPVMDKKSKVRKKVSQLR